MVWLLIVVFLPVVQGAEESSTHFGIRIIDRQTGRGVPMVKLTTVNKISQFTDSAGWIAFREPGLMDRKVFFEVSSHGYQFPADGFGSRGKVLRTTPGKTATVEIDRLNIAERLYRVTGQGIYRDSLILNQRPPLARPLLNGDVVGQDTVQAAVYRGRIHWFWGDSNRPSYPLGQFKTSGAVSQLPGRGGLLPSVGVNLEYFVDKTGFSRQMAPIEGPGAVWLHGLFVLNDGHKSKMIGHYVRLKDLGHRHEHGLVIYNDDQEVFDKLIRFDLDAMLYPRGQALANENDIQDHVYFCRPFPSVRVKAALETIRLPEQYESYTCLKPGARYVRDKVEIERDAKGNPVWAWKKNTDYLDARRQHELVADGHLRSSGMRLVLRDGKTLIHADAGSVHWNAYRKKWIMIAEQIGGKTSFIGEIWYAESGRLEGPWVNVRHIVSHDHYSFYNPAHHPFFDEDGGRTIYFDGTYVTTFSAAKTPTPRYDYNQIMYRLRLDGTELSLPKTADSDQ